jgi:perosamine synthetase
MSSGCRRTIFDSSSTSNMVTRDRINYGRHLVDDDDVSAVVEVLRSEFLTQGPAVERFESAVADMVGAKYAVAVSSGTAALHIASIAAGVAPGVGAVTQPITFVATANGPTYCGGGIHLADIDGDTLAMSGDALRATLAANPDIKVVLPVHMAGLAQSAAELRAISGERVVIEDASHSLGGTYEDGAPVGSCAHSDMTVFSFHPVKSMTTGEGGMVLTNNADLAIRLRTLRSHGIERARDRLVHEDAATEDGEPSLWYYEMQRLGFNYRMSDIQAALGLSQLRKLPRFVPRRREIAARYDEAFASTPFLRPLQSQPSFRKRSAHHLYVVWIDFKGLGTTRSRFMHDLSNRGIGSQVHYVPVHRHPFYADRLGADRSAFPASEHYYSGCLSLPIYPSLTDDNVERVVRSVTGALGSSAQS